MTRLLTLLTLLCATLGTRALDIAYEASLTANAGVGQHAPYSLMALRHGMLTQPASLQPALGAWRRMDTSRRFDWEAGVQLSGGLYGATRYYAWNGTDWYAHGERPAPVQLQQAYATVKYRCLTLTAGLRQRGSAILDNALTSGDLTYSGNVRAMPGVMLQFVDFQDIPFTQGWLQADAALEIAKATDNAYTRARFNYYDGRLNQGWWYTYKRFYFRTNPAQPVSVTVGMQAASQFAGLNHYYRAGEEYRVTGMRRPSLMNIVKAVIPGAGDDYYEGNHLGTWDLKTRIRLSAGHELTAYFQWPWEDGSGIGKLNGYDGLWGVAYRAVGKRAVTGAAIEYLDLTNHSGSIHWDPNDTAGTTITGHATGADDYYNNFQFNGYSYYGMSIGTPMLPGPIYNERGEMQFMANRLRGTHLAVEGWMHTSVSWHVSATWRRAWGTVKRPFPDGSRHDIAVLAQGVWHAPQYPGLQLTLAGAIEAGTLCGNNSGILVGIRYNGTLTL